MTAFGSRDAIGLAEPLSKRAQTLHLGNFIGGNQLKATLEHGIANP